MGEGLIRATVAAAKRTEHVIIVRQPDHAKIVLQCQGCGLAKTLHLPVSIPALTKFTKGMEKEHINCSSQARAEKVRSD